MTHAPLSSTPNPWDQLQQRLRPAPVNERFLTLLGALDAGWQIKEVCRPNTRLAYVFVLSRGPLHSTRELSIPDCAEVQRFLREEGLSPLTGNEPA